MQRMLNLGCGRRYHSDWMNIDIHPVDQHVKRCDICRPLPFDTDTFDVVYHAHVLEHLTGDRAVQFMRECFRVCRPGGIIRVAVPDLEGIARSYLEQLDGAVVDAGDGHSHYDWTIIELFDQMTRAKSGGAMAEYLRRLEPSEVDFIKHRIGVVASSGYVPAQTVKSNTVSKVAKALQDPKLAVRYLQVNAIHWCAFAIGGSGAMSAVREGLFRRSGEVHKWMYDRYSLPRLLVQVGFDSPMVCNAYTSQVEKWCEYGLDIEPDGSIYKPDSLYCEASKPSISHSAI